MDYKMEHNYIVIMTEYTPDNLAAMSNMMQALNAGAMIISATATRDSIHYVIVQDTREAITPSEEERQIALDNMDAIKRVET